MIDKNGVRYIRKGSNTNGSCVTWKPSMPGVSLPTKSQDYEKMSGPVVTYKIDKNGVKVDE